ncbi:hypothetical protein T265_10740 [Opisthorchis viverrini]|uniref:Uncharacterized protein n=1 Tax=Opisthorchis viverrini TaxID=6198 RepID=A0A074Z5H9_OPIVI|nr:hypothetical protein T265_10740 [Opisthorchis viverrini]KER20782.1 hypothetical protein T265_10740 [Opisthorchis viverrini]
MESPASTCLICLRLFGKGTHGSSYPVAVMALPLNEEILSALKTLQKYKFTEAELALKQEAGLLSNDSAEEFFKFKA